MSDRTAAGHGTAPAGGVAGAVARSDSGGDEPDPIAPWVNPRFRPVLPRPAIRQTRRRKTPQRSRPAVTGFGSSQRQPRRYTNSGDGLRGANGEVPSTSRAAHEDRAPTRASAAGGSRDRGWTPAGKTSRRLVTRWPCQWAAPLPGRRSHVRPKPRPTACPGGAPRVRGRHERGPGLLRPPRHPRR